MALCIDFPCCGHTPQDPCGRQWYDEPGAFDTSRPGNEHALCDHENGICEVAYYGEDDDDQDLLDAIAHDAEFGGPELRAAEAFERDRDEEAFAGIPGEFLAREAARRHELGLPRCAEQAAAVLADRLDGS